MYDRLILGLFCVFMFTSVLATEQPLAASCVIKADNQLLMVQDSFNERLALPGGMRNSGETAEATALRETYEETGVRAKIVSHYTNWGAVAIFHCLALTPIEASAKTFNKPLLKRLYAYGAPDVGTEIKHAFLVDINKLPSSQLRFPQRSSKIKKAYTDLSNNSPVNYPEHIYTRAHAIHQIELTLISQFQHAMGTGLKPLFELFNAFGEPILYYLLIPLVWISLGWAQGARLLLLLFFGYVLNELLKIYFGLPRPFDYLPALQGKDIWGYGLPSGHTLIATLFWGFIYTYDWRQRFARYSWIALAFAASLIAGTAAARLYFGVHFISDVLAGVVLGLLCLSLMRYTDKYRLIDKVSQAQSHIWLIIASLLITAVAMTLSHNLWRELWALVGLFFALRSQVAKNTETLIQFNNKRKALFIAIALLGVGTLLLFFGYAKTLFTQNTPLLAISGLQNSCILFWLCAGCYWLTAQLLLNNRFTAQQV